MHVRASFPHRPKPRLDRSPQRHEGAPVTHRLLLAALVALLVSPVANAAITPDDPACVGKTRGQICQMIDGMGGVCAPARCGAGDRPCLRCAALPPETVGTDGDLWVPMLSFGIVVMVIGGVFWFRLKRNWDRQKSG